MKEIFLNTLMIISLFLNISSTAAQESGAEEIYDDLEYTYGSVVSVSLTEIIIKEYNYESDEEVQISYVVSPETKFNKVNSATDLLKDDNVDIYYKIVGEQKVAQLVTKDDTQYETEGEEPADEGMDEVDANAVNSVVPAGTSQPQNESDINASRG